MPQKMSSEFVMAQIEKSLELLAASAADQPKFLEREGVAPNADELALALDDFIVMLPAAVRDGVLSERQAAAIQQVSDFTDSFSGQENAPLWHLDQLGSASQWNEVRRLARGALQMLREEAE
jgi:hypothetical protein